MSTPTETIRDWCASCGMLTPSSGDCIALIAALDMPAELPAPELIDAMEDMLAGWRYIRRNHGDLYGVGWDRAEGKMERALEALTGKPA